MTGQDAATKWWEWAIVAIVMLLLAGAMYGRMLHGEWP